MRLNPQTYALTAVAFERRRIFQRASNTELLIDTMLRYRGRRTVPAARLCGHARPSAHPALAG